MFKRPHHQLIAQLLGRMNASLLREMCCFFAGGTAIALQLDEFRESVDMDFLCGDAAGYRKLRESVFLRGIADLFVMPVEALRELRADQYGVRTVLTIDGKPIKFEIIREDRIHLAGSEVANIPVPCLSRTDLFAEKLLANADRFGDKSVMSRDIIDLLVMGYHWGKIPQEAWDKVSAAYGNAALGAYNKAKTLLRKEPQYVKACLEKLAVDASATRLIRDLC